MAQRLTIQIKNKIASWVSGEPIVCGNGDYEVEFLFDAEWDAHDIKTAIFNVNGDVIPKAFTGTICKVPIIWNTLMVSVGVFAGEIDDGTLSTSTPALVECLRCATDGGDLVDPPKNDVYMDIVQMVEDLNTEIEELKKGGASEEQIADAVEDYLTKNPINESDPTVPEWAKAPEKPKYTAKEVGALSQDELQNGVNLALQQAKESGKFDGNDYVLTEADKVHIANITLGLIPMYNGEVESI